jgi:cyclomaltodextrin glucanotransferase
MRNPVQRLAIPALLTGVLAGCAGTGAQHQTREYVGTHQPMAADAIYFVVTDRFVNGDPGNDQRDQGTFDIPLHCPDGMVANIGYLGGDFRGLLDHANYIADMGFGAVWLTPIVDNPDQRFSGGDEITCTSFLTDRGKAGYHGYWGRNFYRLDEHLPSPGLNFADLTRELRAHGLKTVLDIVGNHSSPAWSMPQVQPGFGQVFDADGNLIADHQNLHPSALEPAGNPLHRMYSTKPDLAQLGDFNPQEPMVLDYLTGAYLQWIEQGAAAFRVDTIRHMPLEFWRAFAARIREHHPGFFMFGEAFDYEAAKIAPFTWPENGAISVLDFPLKQALSEIFGRTGAGFERLQASLFLEGGPYHNPYELMTFYDNHDMARLDASDEGFIDAHNWLFTARGVPVIYYGSEIGFMRGRVEHAGNRNYFGVENIEAAAGHPIRQNLARIARVRAGSPALQRGLQLNLELSGTRAAFYRVYQSGAQSQIALVLLNKGDASETFSISDYLQPGRWQDALEDESLWVEPDGTLAVQVPAHGVKVLLLDAPVRRADLIRRLDSLQTAANRRSGG